jgi:hypothetical protein
MAQKIDYNITGTAGKVSKHLAPLPASSPVAETIIAENEPAPKKTKKSRKSKKNG